MEVNWCAYKLYMLLCKEHCIMDIIYYSSAKWLNLKIKFNRMFINLLIQFNWYD